VTPERLRWQPRNEPATAKAGAPATDFLRGLFRIGESGHPENRDGLAVYSYWCNTSMAQEAFYNADGDMLLLPQQGALLLQTELGILKVPSGHFAVIPRGIRFAVKLATTSEASSSRGFVLEVYNRHFELPDLGPIGANGCASPRDFRYPVAAFDRDTNGTSFQVWCKFQNELFVYQTFHSVFDVVAWHGNYAPFAYDLQLFCPVNAVRFDHMDPSIFTVLTCRSNEPGVALADFVVFPPRWSVQEHTFRPPYFHRNCMTEFMMNLAGEYDAKSARGFPPGASSLHSIMSAHGPDRDSHEKAAMEQLLPKRIPDTNMAAMFETSRMLRLTKEALELLSLDGEYTACWKGFPPASLPAR
jgi:homogentisate 1,2-dioxygenase